MGVYIPGIKLPKNEPGAFKVIVMYVGADGKLRAECEGTHEVVPVPPHGRLIDADALLERYGTMPFATAIVDAPTIIKAEESET